MCVVQYMSLYNGPWCEAILVCFAETPNIICRLPPRHLQSSMLSVVCSLALAFQPSRTFLESGISPDSSASLAAGWVKGARAAASETIELRVALTHNKEGVAAILRVFE